MSHQPQDNQQKHFTGTTTPVNKSAINSTEINDQEEKLSLKTRHQQKDSLPTLPELPCISRAMDFQQSSDFLGLQNQFNQMSQRFHDVFKLFLNHSESQSDAHERKKGFKVIPIDYQNLVKDYSNKLKIIGNIEQLIQKTNQQSDQQRINQSLDINFHQYYLQRHFAGKCPRQQQQLSLQVRYREQNDSQSNSNETVGEIGLHQTNRIRLSNLQNCKSIIQQYTQPIFVQQSVQTQQTSLQLFVESLKLIQVQIPVVIYKIKQAIIKMEQSDIIHNKKFFDDYTLPKDVSVDQNSSNLNIQLLPKDTEVQLCYSDFPQQQTQKLPLQSYAQIQSLISHDSKSNGSVPSRPGTDRDMMIGICGGWMNEQGSHSTIEKMQQNEKILNQQIEQLHQKIQCLQNAIEESKMARFDLQKRNALLQNRLQEQIKQNEYYSSRFDQEGVEIYEQKLQCLTQINRLSDRKILSLTQQLKIKQSTIEKYVLQLRQKQNLLKLNDKISEQKNDEIQYLTKMIQQRQLQLRQINILQENIFQQTKQKQLQLKKQIQKLQKNNVQLTETLNQYKKRIEKDGFCLQYQQANQIQNIIQSKQYIYQLRLKQANQKFQQIIDNIQNQLKKYKEQLKNMNQINNRNYLIIDDFKNKEKQYKNLLKGYCKQFQIIVQDYSLQLQEKDQEIIKLKQDSKIRMNKLQQYSQIIQEYKQREDKIKQIGNNLNLQYLKLKQDNEILAIKYRQATIMVDQLSQYNQNHEAHLIEQLSTQLENVMRQCSILKEKIKRQEETKIPKKSEKNIEIENVLVQNAKIKKMYKKIKQYCKMLQYQIKCIWKVDDCDNHKNLINAISKDRQYFADIICCPQNQSKVPLDNIQGEIPHVF